MLWPHITPVPHVSHRILTQYSPFFFRNTLVQRYLKQLFLDPFGSLWNYNSQRFFSDLLVGCLKKVPKLFPNILLKKWWFPMIESAKDHQLNKPKVTGCTLPATKMAPENGWLEYDPFLLEPGLFSEAMMLVSGSQVTFGCFRVMWPPSFAAVFPS